jgi:dihydroceramidase
MMDELPMIYAALIMTYAMVEHNNVKRKYGYYLPAALIIHGILTTILVGFPAIAPEYSSPVLQFICFHISFALLESFVIFRNIKIWMTERDPKIRRLHVLGMGLWLAAIAFWIIDYTGCETLWEGEDSFRRRYLFLTINNTRVHLPNPQFHAWWHICAASGLYYITLVGACNRMIVLGKPSRVGVLFWIFPYVHVLSEEEKRKLMVDKSVDASDIVGRADTNKSSRGRRRSLTEPEGDNTSQPAETSSSSASATRRRRRQQA